MFGRHRLQTSDLAPVRDVVEIVAILAAGIWAFYTFVYQNEIKPANSPEQAQVLATLTRLGERKGTIAVESHIAIVDAGVTEINLYGAAETVVGTVVRSRAHLLSLPVAAPSAHEIVDATSLAGPPVFLFGFAELTRLASPASPDAIQLRPGQTVPFDRVFYVPAGRFDELEMHVPLRFGAHATPIPFHLSHDHGIVSVVASTATDADGEDGTPATLSLWP